MNPASILSTNAEIKYLKTKPSTNPATFRCFRGSLKAVAPQPKCIRWPVLNPKPALRRPDIPPGRRSACRDLCSLYLHVSCCTSAEPLASSCFRNRLRKRNLRVNKVKPTLPISQRSPKTWSPAQTYSYSGEAHSQAGFCILGYQLDITHRATPQRSNPACFPHA